MHSTRWLPAVLVWFVVATPPVFAQDEKLTEQVKDKVKAEHPSLEALYKHLHSHPELSYQEAATSARLAKELR